MPKGIPMCWKCSASKLADDPKNKGAKVMVGCSDQSSIKNYEDAKNKCPLIIKDDE